LSRHDDQIARHENIACVTVAARQSSPRRDRQIGQPVRRHASIQIVALQSVIVHMASEIAPRTLSGVGATAAGPRKI
jgi:hypothetical protein